MPVKPGAPTRPQRPPHRGQPTPSRPKPRLRQVDEASLGRGRLHPRRRRPRGRVAGRLPVPRAPRRRFHRRLRALPVGALRLRRGPHLVGRRRLAAQHRAPSPLPATCRPTSTCRRSPSRSGPSPCRSSPPRAAAATAAKCSSGRRPRSVQYRPAAATIGVQPGSGGHCPPSASPGTAVIPDNQPQSRKRLKLLQDGPLPRAEPGTYRQVYPPGIPVPTTFSDDFQESDLTIGNGSIIHETSLRMNEIRLRVWHDQGIHERRPECTMGCLIEWYISRCNCRDEKLAVRSVHE
jgi:hypothetical protein